MKTIMTTAALAWAAVAASTTMAQNDLLTPEKLWSMNRVGSQVASPDGKHIAYTVSTPDIQANKIKTGICLIEANGNGRQMLTTGKDSESQPAFLHGGKRIAYLSKGNLWTMAIDGTDRTQLYDKGDLEGFLFSPDGTKVVVIRQIPATSSIQPKEEDLPLATGL
ncbi:MAG: peptidase S9, partial [Bacteroidaceae bacterium]|nr:peptidase S9 [Bacteroidaceae bacterium]